MLRALLVSTLMLAGGFAHAKDLTSRLGVGIKNNTSRDLPALAAVYWPNADLAFTAGVGVDTQKDESALTVNGGIRRVLFREDNLNFYFGGQLGLVNYELATPPSGTEKKSGFELSAVFGAEFFFTGLDSLAFTFEGGVGVASLKDVRFRTIADSPFRAGIIFYF